MPRPQTHRNHEMVCLCFFKCLPKLVIICYAAMLVRTIHPTRMSHPLVLVNACSPLLPLTSRIRAISPHWVHPSCLPGQRSPVRACEAAHPPMWSPAARHHEQGCPPLGLPCPPDASILPSQYTSPQQGDHRALPR